MRFLVWWKEMKKGRREGEKEETENQDGSGEEGEKALLTVIVAPIYTFWSRNMWALFIFNLVHVYFRDSEPQKIRKQSIITKTIILYSDDVTSIHNPPLDYWVTLGGWYIFLPSISHLNSIIIIYLCIKIAMKVKWDYTSHFALKWIHSRNDWMFIYI